MEEKNNLDSVEKQQIVKREWLYIITVMKGYDFKQSEQSQLSMLWTDASLYSEK